MKQHAILGATTTIALALAGAALAGCAAGEGGEEQVGEGASAFTSTASAESWCSGESGMTATPGTCSGCSHAATLYGEIQRIESSVVTSTYTHSNGSGQVNETTYQYNVDCSNYVDYAMCKGMADTLWAVDPILGGRPQATDYFNWITSGGTTLTQVTDVSTLRAGDIIAVQYPLGCGDTGHVIVVGRPGMNVGDPVGGSKITSYNPARYDIPVYDAINTSTSGYHTQDSRAGGSLAVGTGTIAIGVDASNAPLYFYWSENASKPSPISCSPGTVAVGRFAD